MTVLVLTAVPPGLRGHITRWLLEISPGVFVGYVSARVREMMWDRVVEYVDDGRALLVFNSRNEQRLEFLVHGHDWTPVDYDGVTLMRRSTAPTYVPGKPRKPAANEGAIPREETVWKRRQTRRKFKKKS